MALVALVFVIYFLQSNFFNWFTIAGVMPNLFIIFVLFVGLFTNRVMGVIYGVLIGIFLDAVIGKQIGITAVILGVIGFIAATFDKNFSKDSRVTMMFMVFVTTMIFEIASYIINYIIFGINVEIFAFIKILIIEIIYNLAIVIIIYPLMKMFGYFIENEYKGNRILTRYF
jgi:rod shape-determining protein MreD